MPIFILILRARFPIFLPSLMAEYTKDITLPKKMYKEYTPINPPSKLNIVQVAATFCSSAASGSRNVQRNQSDIKITRSLTIINIFAFLVVLGRTDITRIIQTVYIATREYI